MIPFVVLDEKTQNLITLYVRRRKLHFLDEMEIREKTAIHDLTISLNLTVPEVERIWRNVSTDATG